VSERTMPMEDSVLARVAIGDASAIKDCLGRFGGLVWALARRLSPTASDAEDAVQEIFVDVWKSAGKFDPAAGSEATFIAMIARRRLIDRLRARTRRKEDQLRESQDWNDPTDDPRAPRGELAAEAGLAARALEQLRPEQRRVLLLAVFHGLSHEEIAERTGMPLGTVKAHARRGLLRVREVLAGEGGRS
jgi:RNA polymerase sigma factor (sigma-70 family)